MFDQAEQARPWDSTDNALVEVNEAWDWQIGGHLLIVARLDDEAASAWGWQVVFPDGETDEGGPEFGSWQEAAEAGYRMIVDEVAL